MGLLHGRLFPFHRLAAAGQLPGSGGLPDPLALSSEGLEAGGVYVLENGGELLVYLDRDAAPGLVQVGWVCLVWCGGVVIRACWVAWRLVGGCVA